MTNMRNPIVIVLCAYSLSVFAQGSNGTISSESSAASKSATSKIMAPSVAAEARVLEMEFVMRLTKEGEALYQADSEKKDAYEYCSAAFAFSERGEFRQAIRAASKALFLGIRAHNEDILAHATRDLAIAYSYSGDLNYAEKYATEALKHVAYPRNRPTMRSWSYKILGDVALRRGDTTEAISMYEKSIDNSLDDLRFFSRASLASAYITSGQIEKAKDMAAKAESYSRCIKRESSSRRQKCNAAYSGQPAFKGG